MQRGSVRRRRVAGGSDYTEAEIEAVELVTEEREPIPEEQWEDETAGNNKKHNKKKNNNHKNHDPSDAVLEVEIPAEDQAELVPDEAEKEEEWDWRSPEAEEEEEEEEEDEASEDRAAGQPRAQPDVARWTQIGQGQGCASMHEKYHPAYVC
jgi:hypothetical protein